jgi:hypothetical protein
MRLVWMVAGLVAWSGTAAAQAPRRFAMDTADLRVLAEHWAQQQPSDSVLACLFGHRETVDSAEVTVIDSLQLKARCAPPATGVLGFIAGDAYEETVVLGAMRKVLEQYPTFDMAGEVYGLDRVRVADAWLNVPRIWAAVR